MIRFKFTLEYDGGAFVGWQRQENGMSVQQALEEAVFKTCAETVTAHAAGRTDAGVHATGQVAHVDVEKEFTPEKIQAALNFHLKPWPVSIIHAELAPPDFHARFSAKRTLMTLRSARLCDVITSTPSMPASESSSGLVTCDSTTSADAPR